MIKTIKYIKSKVDALKAGRANWEISWQEVGDYLIPRKNDVISTQTPGTKRNQKILDNTGMVALELLTGQLHGLLTNPAAEFFELTTGDDLLDQNDNARLWMQDSVKRIHGALNNSNFQTEVHEFYLDLCGFNTANMTILEDAKRLFIFETHYIKEIFICENNAGIVDEIYRCFEWDAKKIVQEFGSKNLPPEIMASYESGKEEKFEVIHCIYPVDMITGTKRKGFNKPIVSQYILPKQEVELRVEGFNEMPWVVARWAKASGEVYGRGPGMNAMPEVKMINTMEETMITSAQLTMAPPVQAPDDGFILPLKFKPFGVNFFRSGSKDRIEPIFKDARVDFDIKIMDSRRARIRECFYVDQLQLGQQLPQMTATEVTQRTDEKMRFLGPLLGRLQVEFLAPLIERVFAIMERREKLLKPPAELQGKQLSIRYSSAIAKMQRMGDIKALQEFMGLTAPIAQVDPGVLDNLATDTTYRGVATMLSLPQKFLRNQDDVTKMRAQRAEAAKKQQAMAEEAHAAEVAKNAAPAVKVAGELNNQAAV